MGSATTHALTAVRGSLGALGRGDLRVAEGLLAASRVLSTSAPLRSALIDPEADITAKGALVKQVFGSSLPAPAVTLLQEAAAQRWSNDHDFVHGVEEIGVRVAATAAGAADVDGQLLSFARTVASEAELELALGSKLSPTEAKTTVVDRLLGATDTADPATVAIVRHLVQNPRGRRIGAMLREAAAVVADQRGFQLATVTTAVPLSAAQRGRLEKSLNAASGRTVKLDTTVDPAVIGGVRVQLGDDVIDGSLLHRLENLKQRLAG